MTKSTHSKIKNTGILFELLTRQITADTMKGVKNSPALKITQSFFGPKKALTRELVLYQTLVNESFNTLQFIAYLRELQYHKQRTLLEVEER